jgi:hypothetical protein
VYLSHTVELRQFPPGRSFVEAAQAAVMRAGDVVADMADFTARDIKLVAYIEETVRGCDLYVGLIGTRYGSPVAGGPAVSYTELEFNIATEAGLPRLMFLLDTAAADVGIPPDRLIDHQFGARQEAFRNRLLDRSYNEGTTVGRFASPEQLELLLYQALQESRPPVSTAARGRIFMSYRHEESAYPANWLYSLLTEHLGQGQVFMDVDDIEPGAHFVNVINAAVGSCEIMLALIGDRWLTITDADGKRRLDDPIDFVRLEIEAALTRDIRVIPILVSGARMPRPDDLPTSIDELAYRQALELSAHRFKLDLGRLIKALDNTMSPSRN